jgi:hypothetical protein
MVYSWERNVLTAFSDNCGHSLICYHNLKSDGFLKISCNVDSEALSCLYSFLRKSIKLSCPLNSSLHMSDF